jgi:hypothetical protein
MVLTHIKLSPDFIADLWVICPTCGYFVKLYRQLSLFEASGAAEASQLDWCPSCTGGKTNYQTNWLYFTAIKSFVHCNSFMVAPFPDILQNMFKHKAHCICAFDEREFLFSWGRHPIICGTCGLLVWLPATMSDFRMHLDRYKTFHGGQLMALRAEHSFIILDADLAFLGKETKLRGDQKNLLKPLAHGPEKMLIGPRRGELMDLHLAQRAINQELTTIAVESLQKTQNHDSLI